MLHTPSLYKEDIPLFGHKKFFVLDSKNRDEPTTRKKSTCNVPYLRFLIWSCILGYHSDVNSIWRNIIKKKRIIMMMRNFFQDEWEAMLLYLEGVGQIKQTIQWNRAMWNMAHYIRFLWFHSFLYNNKSSKLSPRHFIIKLFSLKRLKFYWSFYFL